MKELSPDDRPREKMRRHGTAVLGDNELVALVLGSGIRGIGALSVANELLSARGGLRGLARSSIDDLAGVAGVGTAKAAQVLAALELGRRMLVESTERPQLRTPREVAKYLLPIFGSRPVEQFGVVLLDTRHRVLRTTIVASGTMNSTIVQPRDVFREAMIGGAAAVVVFHNHPSGDPSPSHDDVELTRRLSAVGVLMGIEVLDHVVLGDASYTSFRETGRL